MDFSNTLKQEQNRLGLNQAELCKLLYGVPLRTLQSWLHDEKLPPGYYQHLIIEKLCKEKCKNTLSQNSSVEMQ